MVLRFDSHFPPSRTCYPLWFTSEHTYCSYKCTQLFNGTVSTINMRMHLFGVKDVRYTQMNVEILRSISTAASRKVYWFFGHQRDITYLVEKNNQKVIYLLFLIRVFAVIPTELINSWYLRYYRFYLNWEITQKRPPFPNKDWNFPYIFLIFASMTSF